MGDQAQNANQVALDLREWVDSITDSPIFCSDSNYDKEQLVELLGEEFTFLRLNIQADHNSGLRPHHALDDARALRASYLKNFSDQELPHQEK